jgi:hypothetical protein
VATAAEDQHVGADGRLQQHLGRMALHDAGTDLDGLILLTGDSRDRFGENLAGDGGDAVALVRQGRPAIGEPISTGACQALTASTVAPTSRAWVIAQRSAVREWIEPSTPTTMRRSCRSR